MSNLKMHRRGKKNIISSLAVSFTRYHCYVLTPYDGSYTTSYNTGSSRAHYVDIPEGIHCYVYVAKRTR